jgi:hypothetical protein
MPKLTGSVGEAATNKTHDVALVQAMLRVVKNAKGTSYLTSNYDGVYGKHTKGAIIAFQNDNSKTIAAGTKGKEKLGVVDAGKATISTLSAALPASHANMRIIPNTKTVYLEDTKANCTTSAHSIRADTQFENTFKTRLANLVDAMFKTHKIVLWVTPTGRRRTFAQQAAEVHTNAGPGESNHNFGRASDIGFKNLKWIRADGTIKTDSWWLNALEHANAAKANAFWDARDALAAKQPLFRLHMERVHLQLIDQATFSNINSLVKLLNTVGAMKWARRYKSDLGMGGALYDVGSAKTIWAGNASVSKTEYAAALSAKTGKAVKAASITQKQIDDMRKALKADFEAADTNWKKWVAVP